MSPEVRRAIYRLLWLTTVAIMTARLASAERFYEPSLYQPGPLQPENNPSPRPWPTTRPLPMPSFGANDRSRWATIRSLVEDQTFIIGQREYALDGSYLDKGRVFQPGYESIDKVLDPSTNCFYSSKPPLLSVMLAGEYWLITKLGFDLDHDRWLVMRFIVWTANVAPLALLLWLFANVIERFGQTDWGRLFTYVAACFGTFLTTFAITLNNHIPAAVATFLAIYPLIMRGSTRIDNLVFSGFFAGLAVCFELPAAAFLSLLFLYLVFSRIVGRGSVDPAETTTPISEGRGMRRTSTTATGIGLAAFLVAALIPIAVQLALTYIAIGTPVPAYAKLGESGAENWYDYPGSYWRQNPGESKHGIDWARNYESRIVYAFHLLLGHHGIFSLSPMWLLAFVGMMMAWKNPRVIDDRSRVMNHILVLTFLVSLIVIVFYVRFSPALNYGGWTSGPRWFFWLTPLWLLGLLRVGDYIEVSQLRLGRCVGLVFLAVSVFSTHYSLWNPWRHPWIYHLLEAADMIPYGK